jgi:hypothetical protein
MPRFKFKTEKSEMWPQWQSSDLVVDTTNFITQHPSFRILTRHCTAHCHIYPSSRTHSSRLIYIDPSLPTTASLFCYQDTHEDVHVRRQMPPLKDAQAGWSIQHRPRGPLACCSSSMINAKFSSILPVYFGWADAIYSPKASRAITLLPLLQSLSWWANALCI